MAPAVVVAFGMLLGGCSIMFVTPPRDNLRDHGAAECTDNPIFPVLDGLVGTAAGIEAFRLSQRGSGGVFINPALGLWIATAIVSFASMAGGVVSEGRCSDLQREQSDRSPPIRPTPRPPLRPIPPTAPPPADEAGGRAD
jgi:hypothetical protein